MNPHPLELDDKTILELGRQTFARESEAIRQVGAALTDQFVKAVRLILDCQGTVVVTGLGKSGIVARKIAATLTSTGTPSHFIHPVEAAHGDLGVVRGGDVLLAVSRSGNNPEVNSLLVKCKQFGMSVIAITGSRDSDLVRHSDIVLHCPITREACPLNLTPTTSAAVAMVMGDALTLSLLELRGFSEKDFASFHPSGVLGRSLLLKVDELMHQDEELPVVSHRLTLRESLPEIVSKRLGGTCIVDDEGVLAGICVDGDVKRCLLAREDALDRPITEAMNPEPTTIGPETLAISALRMMEERPAGPITSLIVVDHRQRPIGLLHIHDVLRAGLF